MGDGRGQLGIIQPFDQAARDKDLSASPRVGGRVGRIENRYADRLWPRGLVQLKSNGLCSLARGSIVQSAFAGDPSLGGRTDGFTSRARTDRR